MSLKERVIIHLPRTKEKMKSEEYLAGNLDEKGKNECEEKF